MMPHNKWAYTQRKKRKKRKKKTYEMMLYRLLFYRTLIVCTFERRKRFRVDLKAVFEGVLRKHNKPPNYLYISALNKR